MAGKAWFSLRPNQIIKRVKSAGWKDFSDIYLGTTVRLMPEPMSVIGDDNWDGKSNFIIKFELFILLKLSEFLRNKYRFITTFTY